MTRRTHGPRASSQAGHLTALALGACLDPGDPGNLTLEHQQTLLGFAGVMQ